MEKLCGQKRMKCMQVSFLSEVILIPTNLVHCWKILHW